MKANRFEAGGSSPEEIMRALKEENVALQKENEELKREVEAAKIDSVTGLKTRRELDKLVAQEVGPEKETTKETAVLMLDIDNFKIINDLYGHPNGDLILRAVGDKLKEMFRKEDLIMRYGGEEMAVILPKTDAEKLIHKFYDPEKERPRLSVKVKVRIGNKEEEVEATMSGGLTTLGPDGDLHAALTEADQALYAAKEDTKNKDGTITRGRDRILLYSDITPDA